MNSRAPVDGRRCILDAIFLILFYFMHNLFILDSKFYIFLVILVMDEDLIPQVLDLIF